MTLDQKLIISGKFAFYSAEVKKQLANRKVGMAKISSKFAVSVKCKSRVLASLTIIEDFMRKGICVMSI